MDVPSAFLLRGLVCSLLLLCWLAALPFRISLFFLLMNASVDSLDEDALTQSRGTVDGEFVGRVAGVLKGFNLVLKK